MQKGRLSYDVVQIYTTDLATVTRKNGTDFQVDMLKSKCSNGYNAGYYAFCVKNKFEIKLWQF